MKRSRGTDKRFGRAWLAATVVAAVVLLTAASCGDDDPDGPGLNDPTSTPPSTSASASPSPSPSVDRDAWRSKFTEKQLREFDDALRTWKRFGQLMEPHYRQPTDADKVRRIFQRYTYNATGYTDSYTANYLKGGVRVIKSTTPLYVTGRKVKLDKKGGLVEFDQCTDYREVDMRRNGKPMPTGVKNDTAILRVQMAYDPGTSSREGGWRVFTSPKVVDKPCE